MRTQKLLIVLSHLFRLDKKELFFDDVIQISLAAAQLCDFPIGDPVVIRAKDGQCIVKPMWPVEDNVLSSVFLTKQSTI